MLGQLLMIIAGILALVGAGVFSYFSFEGVVGPRQLSQEHSVVVAKEEVAVATSSTKKVATTTRANGGLVPKTTVAEKKVVAPGPLRLSTSQSNTVTPQSLLTVRGIIEYTNNARFLNGELPALVENELLDRDAQMKLEDMFTKQYFEHISPTGVGPSDLAKTVGYEYVIVGENLALGDFVSDQEVVTAWMNSSGHRANILNTEYQEIGVAAKRGLYEGREVWIAVQSFGMPLSACPAIPMGTKTQIDTNNNEIAQLRATLDIKKAQLDTVSQNEPAYNIFINEFNSLVPLYNLLVEETRTLVTNYNASVQFFNDCISAAGSH